MPTLDQLVPAQTAPPVAVQRPRWWWFAAAGVILTALYAANVIYCHDSALHYLDAFFIDSDMHANLLWAEGIRQQGWLDPTPYHPYTGWMQQTAPYPQWLQWWGGQQIFQQSPLYAYLLSLFIQRTPWMRICQAAMSVATCVLLGLLTRRIAGQAAGWFAFVLAALYAPFYLYSWPFLRDGLNWFLSAALLFVLSKLVASDPASRSQRLEFLAGILLGLGFLAKETYLLIIPITWIVLAAFAWQKRQWSGIVRVASATILTISPLLIRNAMVHAPLLSSSNRLAETFIQGNAGDASPTAAVIPSTTGAILSQSGGKTWPLFRATIASHPQGFYGWSKLQLYKLRALFDPYESPDNLSFYFVAHISPLVRFGLRYWMILPLGLAGLFQSVWRRERAHLWLWVLFPIFFVSMFVGIPLSRYRQSLMIFLIPLAAYFLTLVANFVRQHNYRSAVISVLAVALGWALILGPLSRQPRAQYERRLEYLFTAQIWYRLGDVKKEHAAEDLIRQKFPGFLPQANEGVK